MKARTLLIGLTFFILHFTLSISHAQDPSAIAEYESTTQGLLLPKMTEAQRDAISNPATGLLIYQTDGVSGFYYNTGFPAGPVWIRLGSIANELSDADGDTKIEVEKILDEDVIRMQVKGTSFLALKKNANGYLRMDMADIFIGENAGEFNQSGNFNTGIGNNTLRHNTTGNNNIAIGFDCLKANTSGGGNVAIGTNTLQSNLDGDDNTAVGSAALYANSSGDYNTAIGKGALQNNVSGDVNTAVGESAMYQNEQGMRNTALGRWAMYNNSSGSDNTAIGYYALPSSITQSQNTAVGSNALQHTTNNSNTGVGYKAMLSNTIGAQNVAIGHSSMEKSETGSNNVVIGYHAGRNDTNSVANVIIGHSAGRGGNLFINDKHAKTKNVIIGKSAGYFTKGDGNVMIGYNAGYFESGSNKFYLDNTNDNGDAVLLYGDFENDWLRVNDRLGVGRNPGSNALEIEGEASKTSSGDWLANSDERLKKNIEQLSGEELLDLILQIKGVSYEWNDDQTGIERPEGIHYGMIAQDIQKVFPTLVSEDVQGFLQTGYGTYDAMYIEIIRYLQDRISQLEKENAALAEKVDYNESDLAILKIHMVKLEKKMEEMAESPQ